MKTIYKLLTAVSVAALISGCGGGGGGGGASSGPVANTQSDATSQVKPLNIGERTAVKPGDKIIDASDDAVMDIVVRGQERFVTLKSGSASLETPQY